MCKPYSERLPAHRFIYYSHQGKAISSSFFGIIYTQQRLYFTLTKEWHWTDLQAYFRQSNCI